jgi:hypothetical protein
MNLLNVCDHQQQIKITVIKKLREDSIVLSKGGIYIHQYKLLLTERSPLRRRKSALDCSAIKEDDEEDYILSANIIHIMKLLYDI